MKTAFRVVAAILLLWTPVLGQTPTAPPGADALRTSSRSPHGWVYVTPSDGGTAAEAVLLRLEPDTVDLLVDGAVVTRRLSSISRIERKGDSLRNGTIVGAAVGFAYCLVVCSQGLDNARQARAVAIATGGIGGLIGLGIDAANEGRTTIYPAGKAGGSARRAASFGMRIRF